MRERSEDEGREQDGEKEVVHVAEIKIWRTSHIIDESLSVLIETEKLSTLNSVRFASSREKCLGFPPDLKRRGDGIIAESPAVPQERVIPLCTAAHYRQ